MSAAERSQVVLPLAVNTPRHRGHLASSSGVKLSKSSKVKVSLFGRKEEEEGPAPASGYNPTQKMWMLAYARIFRNDM